MADIKIELSTDPQMGSSSIRKEAAWLTEEGTLSYPLHVKPVATEEIRIPTFV
jgi:hypothetical protein